MKRRARSRTKNPEQRKYKIKLIQLLLFIFLFLLVVLSGQMYFQKKADEKPVLKKAGMTAIPSRCRGNLYQNKEQGYEVCLPGGWSYREFGEAKETVGFDERPIPVATEYMGRFLIQVTDKNFSEVKNQLASSLVGLKEGEITIDGVKGEKLEGTIFSAASFFAGQSETAVLFEKNKRTYSIVFMNTADGYIAQMPVFLSFVDSFTFASITPFTTLSDDGNLLINAPLRGAVVSSPLSVRGKIKNGDLTIYIKVLDRQGDVLGQTSILVKPAAKDDFSAFSGSVLFYPQVTPEEGKLLIYNLTKEGKETEKLEIPLIFR